MDQLQTIKELRYRQRWSIRRISLELIGASIPQQLEHAQLDVAVKSSFGFGDVNTCLVFRRWTDD